MTTKQTLVIVVVLLILAVVGAVQAVELFTAPLTARSFNSLLCFIVNVSDTARTVRIEIFDLTGALLTGEEHMLGPGEAEGMGYGASGDRPLTGYCKFTVQGLKRTVRASRCVVRAEPGDDVGCVAALPAE